MRGRPSRLRSTALITAGALTLHELRYLVGAPAAERTGAGHGYLPLAGLACALVLAWPSPSSSWWPPVRGAQVPESSPV